MEKNNQAIGIFDSGVGGLTVLQELAKLLPNEKFIYFGDTAHVPYGNKSKSTIEKYCLKIVGFLMKKEVKLIIVACNSASSSALNAIKKHTETPILNVIDPCIDAAIKKSDLGLNPQIDGQLIRLPVPELNIGFIFSGSA